MDYDALFAEQDGKCAICGKKWEPLTKHGTKARKMHRDHNHKTLQGRGLLCHHCNRHLKDAYDAPWYLAAYNYLRRHNG